MNHVGTIWKQEFIDLRVNMKDKGLKVTVCGDEKDTS